MADSALVHADEERVGFYWVLAVAWFFHGIGVVLVGQAVWNQVSKRRFGKTFLALAAPAYLGERLDGLLTIPRIPAEFPGPIAVTAQCVEVHHRDKRVNTEKVLWKHEVSGELQKGGGGWQAALSVELPKTKPPTRSRTSGDDDSYSIRWRLLVHIPMKGMDFERTYPVKVSAREK